MRDLFRRLRRRLPRSVRVEGVRLRRLPAMLLEAGRMARRPPVAPACPITLAEHRSPLLRPGADVDPTLQAGKEANIRAVVRALDGAVIAPYQIFSYHHLVGRPSTRRGFRAGMELHDEKPVAGIGGGACKVSNLLYLLGLRAGLRVVERHRHALDIFPDVQRTVPFGCGATVFYTHADLRLQNPYPWPIRLDLKLLDGHVCGWLRSPEDPGVRFEIVERDHRFVERDGAWWRENRIVRRILAPSGRLIAEFTVARNRGRTLYTPHPALTVEPLEEVPRCAAR